MRRLRSMYSSLPGSRNQRKRGSFERRAAVGSNQRREIEQHARDPDQAIAVGRRRGASSCLGLLNNLNAFNHLVARRERNWDSR
jgi:hypothetical protein